MLSWMLDVVLTFVRCQRNSYFHLKNRVQSFYRDTTVLCSSGCWMSLLLCVVLAFAFIRCNKKYNITHSSIMITKTKHTGTGNAALYVTSVHHFQYKLFNICIVCIITAHPPRRGSIQQLNQTINSADLLKPTTKIHKNKKCIARSTDQRLTRIFSQNRKSSCSVDYVMLKTLKKLIQ
jgi:hypothetical protein